MAGFYDSQSSGDGLHNGYLFQRQRMNRVAQHGTYGTFPSQSNTVHFAGQEPYYPPASTGQFVFVPSGSPPPGMPLTEDQPSTSDATSKGESASKTAGKRWEDLEVKLLIEAYKENHDRLKSAKSSRGKKSAWEIIYDDYIQLCNDAKIKTTKTLVQAKEKWRALFDKYKAVCDNNQRTGRGRMDFEYFEAIDEFMGQSDKFVKEAAIINDQDDTNEEDSPGDTSSEVADETDGKQEKKQTKKSDDSIERPKKKGRRQQRRRRERKKVKN